MAGVHQRAQGGHVAAPHGLHRLKRAPVLGNHVQGTAPRDVVQAAGLPGEHLRGHVAQGGHAEELGRRLAPAAALVVGRIDQAAPRGRVEHDGGNSGGEGHGLGRQRAAVDQQRVPGTAGGRNQLVHDPAVHADPLVLRSLSQPGHARRVPREVAGGGQGPGGGHLQGGGRGEPRPQGHVAHQHTLPGTQIAAGLLEAPGDSLEVFDPTVVLLGQAVERELAPLIVVDRMNQHGPVIAGAQRDPDRPVDGQWEDKAVVVIRVFPDQVDASRGADDPARRPAKLAGKARGDLVFQRHRSLARGKGNGRGGPLSRGP